MSQSESIIRREVLRLKALVLGKDGVIARSYVVEKIDLLLADISIPLDERNESIYRELVERERQLR